MTAALSILGPISRQRAAREERRGLQIVAGAGAGATMSLERETRRDEWSTRVVAIAEREDRTAFAELFGFFAPRVKAYLQKGGTGEALADDLAQETMIAVWRKARLYDPGSASAATWIFTIARNLRIDAIRRERRGGVLRVEEVEAEFEVDDGPLADVRLMSGEAETRVRRALRTLPKDQLRVIEMSFFEERPHGEIARTLQIPLGTVKSRVRLAMNRLRALLSELR